ncbi:endo alpha-1,4 polygalactosaminidase [Actinoplanes sp. NPDC049118]|uniref:endo alpha-1,4 polygalactosaminidase n=1 Tax=Actinoplanes sp. NPDC049118 TaxID=3155769 RepID=UPI0033C1471F
MSVGRYSTARWRPRLRGAVVAGAALVLTVGVGVGVATAGDSRPDRPGGGMAARDRPTPPADPTATPPGPAPAPTATGSGTMSAPHRSGTSADPSTGTVGATEGGNYAPPPANAGVDYQIGTAYPPPAGVDVVLRDHGAAPAAGKYNVCYVNGYQTQPEDADWWHTHHRDLLLTSGGQDVIDEEWGEILLDISTPAKRSALATIVNGWIDECASKGFKAVEVDNLDTFTRSKNLLTADHATAYGKLLADHAHSRDLAIGQKNAAELATEMRPTVGFDFAIAEECAHWDECESYTEAYGDHVVVIEYTARDFGKACRGFGSTLSIVLRDRQVTAPGSPGYVFKNC